MVGEFGQTFAGGLICGANQLNSQKYNRRFIVVCRPLMADVSRLQAEFRP